MGAYMLTPSLPLFPALVNLLTFAITTSSKSREMHRALQQEDILSAIFEQCTTGSIARAAGVCRAWEKIANDILWKSVTNVWTLMQLLGPLEDGERGTVRYSAMSSDCLST